MEMKARDILLIIQYISILGLFLESWIILRHWKNSLHTYLFLSCIATFLNNLGYLFELKAGSEETYLTALKLSYAGRVWICLMLFLFTAKLCRIRISDWLTRILVLAHLGIYISVFTLESHKLYYSWYEFVQGDVFPKLDHGNGLIYYLFFGIQVTYIVMGLVWIIRDYRKEKKRTARRRLLIVLCAFTIEAVFYIVQIFDLISVTAFYDVTMFGFFLSTLIMLIAIFRYDLLGMTEIAKDFVIDRITEGIIAADSEGMVEYFNKPASRIYPELKTGAASLPAGVTQAVMDHGTVTHEGRIYTPVENELCYHGEAIGKLFMLVDDTEHYQYEEKLEKEVDRQTRRSKRLTREMMFTLSRTVDTKDHYTDGHSRRVAAICAEIGRRMGKSDREQVELYEIGLLHDIGKIGIHEDIIHKSTRLTDDEFAAVKAHTIKGYEILKEISDMPELSEGARWHHERFNGTGYPDRLKEYEIPERARIACIADCYDAMTSTRTYSVPKKQSDVRAEIERCRGTWFDPQIADVMLAMIDEDTDYRMNETAELNDVWKNYDRLWGNPGD
ncbi:MAG: HD domain-containing protein [Anaerolineaceae bacterium]|nr:HD domain-containing protein [Anaerolineaceae bacterium]